MCYQDPEQESYDEDGEKIQETDADVVKKDLIQVVEISIKLEYYCWCHE